MIVNVPRMARNINKIWIMSVFFIKILRPVNLQFGVVYAPAMVPPPAPVFPMPAPIPVMAPALAPAIIQASSSSEETKATTTTTKKPKKKKKCSIIFPNIPPYGFKPQNAKPVLPIIAPPPLVLVPVPPVPPPRPPPILRPRPRRPRKECVSSSSSDSDEYTDTSNSFESFNKRRYRYRKHRRQKIYRRNLRSSESDNELLKPMLRYVADNGDVKFETKINNADVGQLLGKKNNDKKLQTIQVITRNDEVDNPQVVVISKGERTKNVPGRYKRVLLRGGASQHVLGDGKKELIFRPPADKKISNISVSFQIS